MKTKRFLPSVLILLLCIAVLGVGIWAVKPASNTVTGTVTVNSANANVEITLFRDVVDEAHRISEPRQTRVGLQDLDYGTMDLDSEYANNALDIESQKLIIRVRNLSDKELGVYFWNRGEAVTPNNPATLSDILGGRYIYDGSVSTNVFAVDYEFYKHLGLSDTITMAVTVSANRLAENDETFSLPFYLNVEPYTANFTGTDNAAEATGFVKVASTVSTLPTFTNNTNITAVVMPKSVTAVPADAFNGATALTRATISDTTTSIGASAFEGSGLSSITIPASVASIGNSAFKGTALSTVTVPKTVTTLGTGVFENNTSLTTAVMDCNVATLPENTFKGCTALTTVALSADITALAENAVSGATALTTYVWKVDYDTDNVAATVVGAKSYAIPANQTSVNGIIAGVANYPSTEHFAGWRNGSLYNAGADYTFRLNNRKFLALWQEAVEVTYNANGGTGTYSEYIVKGEDYTFPALNDGISRTDYYLLGWSTNANAETPSIERGETLTMAANESDTSKTYYAVWKLVYIAPLSDFDWYPVDGNEDGNIDTTLKSESTEIADYIVLEQYNGSHANYIVLEYYSIQWDSENEEWDDVTDYAAAAAALVANLNDLEDTYSLPVRQLGASDRPFDMNAQDLIIPESVDTIGNGAFTDGDLENLAVRFNAGEANETDVTVYSSSAAKVAAAQAVVDEMPAAQTWVSGVYIGYEAFVGTAITNVTIPSGVDFTINQAAFEPTASFTYNGQTYSSLEALQEAMDAAGDSLTLDTSVLYTQPIGSGGGRAERSYYYDPTGAHSYVTTEGTWTFDVLDDGTAALRTFEADDSYYGEWQFVGDYSSSWQSNVSGTINNLTLPATVEAGGITYTVTRVSATDANKNSALHSSAYCYPQYDFIKGANWNSNRYNNGLTDGGLGGYEVDGRYRLTGTLTIPASIVDVGYEFSSSDISSLVVNGDTYMNFSGCKNLQTVTANELTTVYNDCFYGCTSLTSITLPKTDCIQGQAFNGCTSLHTVNAPILTEIGGGSRGYDAGVFAGCTSLSKFNSSENGVFDLHNITKICGVDYAYDQGSFQECTAVTKVIFGQNVYIGARAFYNCSNLSQISFAVPAGNSGTSAILPAADYQASMNYSVSNGKITLLDSNEDTPQIWINDTNENGEEDEGDDYANVTTYEDNNMYTLTGINCELYVNGEPAETSYLAGTTIDLTVSIPDGYIHSISYYSLELNEQNKYQPTLVTISANDDETLATHVKEYTLENFVINMGQRIIVEKGYKITINEETRYSSEGFSFAGERNGNIVKICRDSHGKTYYPNLAYSPDYYDINITQTINSYAYDVTFDFGSYWPKYASKEIATIYSYEGYKLKLPTFNGYYAYDGQYISGWTDGENRTYYFNKQIVWGDLDTRSETVIISNPTTNLTLYPILSDTNVTVTFSGGNNKIYINPTVYYTYYGFVRMVNYNGGYGLAGNGETYFYDPVNRVGMGDLCSSLHWSEFGTSGNRFITSDNITTYNFVAQLPQYDSDLYVNNSVVAYVDNIYGYGGTVINVGNVKVETGYTEEEGSPTITQNIYARNVGSYVEFCLDVIDVGEYYFVGFRNEQGLYNGYLNHIQVNVDGADTTLSAQYIKIDTGYTATGETPTYDQDMIGKIELKGQYYQIPSPEPANEYTFIGWRDSKTGYLYGPDGQISVGDTTLIAEWTKIQIDTGYTAQNSPTTTQSMDIVWTAGGDGRMWYYRLPIEGIPQANPGYIFKGWSNDGGETILQTNGSYTIFDFSDTTWVAQWIYVTVDTGYTLENSPTSTETVSVVPTNDPIDGHLICYNLPSAPTANSGYVFFGWSNDGGTTVRSDGYAVSDLTSTTWTAVWAHIIVDTGYTASNSPTSTQSAVVSYGQGYSEYRLPSMPTANANWLFLGWTNDGGSTYTNAETWINNINSATWTAGWSYITIDTGYTAQNSPTSTQVASISVGLDANNTEVDWYALPSAPTANDGYIFRGWTNDGGTTIRAAGYATGDLTSTTWTAVWSHITVDTGYTAQNSPTSTVSASLNMISEFGYSYYLPSAPTANSGYYFYGWTPNNGQDIYSAEAGVYDPNYEYTSWTACWMNLVFDTGYTCENSPTSTETAAMEYYQELNQWRFPLPVANSGYEFAGWVEAGNETVYWNGYELNYDASNTSRTFTAQWRTTNIAVTFNANGGDGSVPSDDTVSRYNSLYMPDSNGLTKTDYSFAGWSLNSDGSGTIYYPYDYFNTNNETPNQLTFYAVWISSTVNITWSLNGGDGYLTDEQTSAERGNWVSCPGTDNISNNGLVFVGWSTDSSATTGQTGSMEINNQTPNNVTFYAIWRSATVNVQLLANDGTEDVIDTLVASRGGSVELPGTDRTRSGYTFGGWSTWAEASNRDYSANDWYPVDLNADDTISLYAFWLSTTITVHFNTYAEGSIADQIVTRGNSFTLPDSTGLVNGDYVLINWNGQYRPGDTYTTDENTNNELYFDAYWAESTMTIYFDAEKAGGTLDFESPVVFTRGNTFDFSNYTVSGGKGTLLGWDRGGNSPAEFAANATTDFALISDSEITLYAVFGSATVTFSFSNGKVGYGSMSDEEVTRGQSLTFPSNGFSADGYSFIGWDTDMWSSSPQYQPGDTYTTDANTNENITFYAIWQEAYNEFIFEFVVADLGDYKENQVVRVRENSSNYVSVPNVSGITNNGDVIVGWSTTQGASEPEYVAEYGGFNFDTKSLSVNTTYYLYPVWGTPTNHIGLYVAPSNVYDGFFGSVEMANAYEDQAMAALCNNTQIDICDSNGNLLYTSRTASNSDAGDPGVYYNFATGSYIIKVYVTNAQGLKLGAGESFYDYTNLGGMVTNYSQEDNYLQFTYNHQYQDGFNAMAIILIPSITFKDLNAVPFLVSPMNLYQAYGQAVQNGDKELPPLDLAFNGTRIDIIDQSNNDPNTNTQTIYVPTEVGDSMDSMFAWGVFEDGITYTIKVYVNGNQGVYNQSQGQQGSAIQKTDGDGYVEFEYTHSFVNSDYRIWDGFLVFMADVDYSHTSGVSVSTMSKPAFDGMMDLMQEIGENEPTSEQANLQQQYMQTMYSGYRVEIVEATGRHVDEQIPTDTSADSPSVSFTAYNGQLVTIKVYVAPSMVDSVIDGSTMQEINNYTEGNGYIQLTYTYTYVENAENNGFNIMVLTKATSSVSMYVMPESTFEDIASGNMPDVQSMFTGATFEVVDPSGNSTSYTIPSSDSPAVEITLVEGLTYTFRTTNSNVTGAAYMLNMTSDPSYPTTSTDNGYIYFTYTHEASKSGSLLAFLLGAAAETSSLSVYVMPEATYNTIFGGQGEPTAEDMASFFSGVQVDVLSGDTVVATYTIPSSGDDPMSALAAFSLESGNYTIKVYSDDVSTVYLMANDNMSQVANVDTSNTGYATFSYTHTYDVSENPVMFVLTAAE